MTGTVLQPIFLQLTVYFLLSHEFYLNFGVWRSDADFFGHESPVRTNYFMQFMQLLWKEKEGDLICILLFWKCLQDGILSLNYYLEIPGDSKRHHPFPHPPCLTSKTWVLSPKPSRSSLTTVWREVTPCWNVPVVAWWLWQPAHFRNVLTVFCCSLLSRWILPVFNKISVSISQCCLIP